MALPRSPKVCRDESPAWGYSRGWSMGCSTSRRRTVRLHEIYDVRGL